VTDRKQAEEALRKSKQRFKELYDNAPVGYFEYDTQGRITNVNRTELEILGYTFEEMIGQPVWKFVIEEEIARQQILAKLAGTMPPARGLERTYRRKDGTTFPGIVEDRFILDSEGKIKGIRATIQDITERKRAGEALRESEKLYRTLIETSPDAILLADTNTNFIMVNQMAVRLYGYQNVGEMIGKTFLDHIPPEERPRLFEHFKKTLQTGNSQAMEHTALKKDGSSFPAEINASLLVDTQGRPKGTIAIVRDITERKRAGEMLGASEERYRTLFEGAAEGILVADIESKQFKYVNPATCRMLGYTAEELTRLSLADIHPKEALDYVVAEFEAQARGEKTLSPEIPCLRKDGSVIYTSVLTTPVVIDGRKCNVGFFTDITERKRAEEVLRESEKRFKLAAESSTDLIYEWDIKERVDWFGKIDELLGYSPSEFPRTIEAWANSVHPEDRDRVMVAVKNHLEKNEPYNIEYRVRKKDGTYNYWWVRGNAVRDEKGNPYRWVGAVTDITERKRVEDVLRESEERSRSLIETSPDMIALIDFSGKIILMNGVALTTYGYESKDELIGKSVLDFVIPEDRPRVLQEISKVLEVKTLRNLEYTSLKKDGSTFSIEVSASLILDAQQKPTSIVIMIRNITERKRATAELVNLNKQLEAAKEAAEAGSRAKGEFLASMSHEIRTPLNAVIGMLGLLSTSELNGPHREYVEIAHSSADGLLAIINDILDFSKIEAGKLLFEPVPFDLLRVVEETIDMMVMKTREKGFDLTVQYGPDVPRHFIGDSGHIRQVLINLVNNAIKFTHKGHVLIDVRAEEQMNEEVLLRITVEDTGIGISSDKLDSLFKPFVQADASTTRRYGGTGLGLAISKRLVEMMGGTIGASSRMGEGSAFWFTLCLPLDKQFTGVAVPMAEKVALHPPAESGVTQTALPKTARWGRLLRVLVVEDNVVNQKVTMLMLTELGCHMDLAANGREAVEMIELLPFDMVFMDCEMPEMDGFEATREIRRLQGDKHLPIIAMTAYALQGDRERCLAAGMDDYFSKPVKLEDFQAALERWGPKDSRSFEGRLKPPAFLEKAPLTVENETSSVIDPNVIARLRRLADATDPSLLTRIFHLFLSDTPERITTLREAATTGDTAGLSKAAHSLRGACASIGVMGMVEICKTLESLGHGKYVDGAMALVEKLETEFNQVKVEIEREIAPSPPPSPLGGEEKGEGYSVKDKDIEENDQNEDSHFGR
jgi:PAS domain S-box-containing protein